MMLFALVAAHAQQIERVEPGDTVVAAVPSYLLPEPYYDRCLEKAQQLPLVVARVEEIEGELSVALGEVEAGLSACSEEMDALDDALAVAYQDRLRLEAQVVGLRHQRNLTLAVASGLLLGGVTVALLR
jgi:hypothetical protein